MNGSVSLSGENADDGIDSDIDRERRQVCITVLLHYSSQDRMRIYCNINFRQTYSRAFKNMFQWQFDVPNEYYLFEW
jgi:hypothetical protein